jgi:hypothetical protein
MIRPMGIWKPLWVWLWGARGQRVSGCENTKTSAGAGTAQDAQWIQVAPDIEFEALPAQTEDFDPLMDLASSMTSSPPELEDVLRERKLRAEELLKQLKAR